MQRKIIVLFAIMIVAAMTLSLWPTTVSASKEEDDIAVIVFTTTYGAQDPNTASTDQYDVFEYTGIHWADNTVVTYKINPAGAPSGTTAAVKAGFETWDAAIGNTLFNDNVNTVKGKTGTIRDKVNVVSWGRLPEYTIAQTTVWYNARTNLIVEFGMVFNTGYAWGIDADGEGSTSKLTNAFDVQNIATHEAGHTLMLGDLYMDPANQLTMYGYGDYGQTYARSLGVGDINGINYIY
jgi:hypothetical protein